MGEVEEGEHSHTVSLDEQLRPLFQQVLPDPYKEIPDVPWRGGKEQAWVRPLWLASLKGRMWGTEDFWFSFI